MAKPKRSSRKPASKQLRRTAIVPRVVFQTALAMTVVPVAAASITGCGVSPAAVDAQFSVAADGGFSVAADGGFSVADVGFAVAVPVDANFSVADVGPPGDTGGFSVADGGTFSVAVEPADAGLFSVAVPAPDAAS